MAQERMPPEIISLIISELRLKGALQSCALVCKEWAFFAQSQLFYKMTFGDDPGAFPLQTMIDHLPHISQHVRIVDIRPSRDDQRETKRVRLLENDDWRTQLSCARNLRRVHTIHLRGLDDTIIPININALVFELNKFQCLDMLMLTGCKFSELLSFETLVMGTVRLNEVYLDNVCWNVASTDNEHPVAPHWRRSSFKLSALQIGRFCSLEDITRWITGTACKEGLETLELKAVEADQLSSAGHLLQSFGPHLKYLTLGCNFSRYPHMQDLLGNYLPLSATSALHTIRIRILDLSEGLMRWIVRVLDELISPELRKVIFDIWLWSHNQLRSAIWDHIALLLESPRFSMLETVTFVQRTNAMEANCPMTMDTTRLSLRWRFPGLAQRDILRVIDARDL